MPAEFPANTPPLPQSRPFFPAGSDVQKGDLAMTILTMISFDEIAASLMLCLVARELMILGLPDQIAGPGGWLIDTGEEEA